MLLGQMEVGVRDFGGQHKAIMLHASGFSQLLKFLGAQHLSQRIRCIYGTIDNDVSDVNAF